MRFYVPRELQRPGLSLDGNNLLIAFGSYGDIPPFHGWILAYDKTSLKPTGVFNDTPNGKDGGIWNSGTPMVTDSQGFIYTETGNGSFDTRQNRAGFPVRGNYGDSVLKLALKPGYKGPNGTGFKVVDYFTPRDQKKLEKGDGDLASSGVLILPTGSAGRRIPTSCSPQANREQSTSSTEATWAISRNGSNRIVQTLRTRSAALSTRPRSSTTPIYYAGVDDVAKSFTLSNGLLVQTGQATNTLPWPGATPVISSDGTSERHRLGGLRLERS